MAEPIDANGQQWVARGNVTGHFGEFAPPGTISYALAQSRPLLLAVWIAAVALIVLGGGRR